MCRGARTCHRASARLRQYQDMWSRWPRISPRSSGDRAGFARVWACSGPSCGDRQEDAGSRHRRHSSMRWVSIRSTWLATTSATWWPMPSRRNIPPAFAKLVLIDAPVPGLGDAWESSKRQPFSAWHFNSLHGPDEERLVAGPRADFPRSLSTTMAHPASQSHNRSARASIMRRLRMPNPAQCRFPASFPISPHFPHGQAIISSCSRMCGRLAMPVLAVRATTSLG